MSCERDAALNFEFAMLHDRDFLIQEFLTAMGMAMVKYELCGDGVESGREDEVVFDRVH